ncbi:aminopeptidase YwaD-like isoform X1 [Mytilus trossulus]|uniref:aminopeptidase YwaD-like n=1 Tax=Mytilus trossulus TaxID=6551 RepID=UPI003005FE5D
MVTSVFLHYVINFLFSLHCVKSADTKYMETSIRNYFSDTRHHDSEYKDYKYAAKEYIHGEFLRYGLTTEYHTFQEQSVSNTENFQSVIGIAKGTNFGKANDLLIGLGAHYDTVKETKGVNDNGAGVAAMLEVVRQLTDRNRNGVKRKNTIIFVAFDLEEYGSCRGTSDCKLPDVPLAGSRHFLQEWISPWLQSNYGNAVPAVIHGVIILDTMMNYNTSAQSQTIPLQKDAFETAFPEAYASISSDNFQGDFLNLIYRKPTNDSYLAKEFLKSWGDLGNAKYEIESLPLTFTKFSEISSSDEKNILLNFMRSDHGNFWEMDLPAIWLTDSADFRGDMIQCYHQECDNLQVMLTDENIDFLGKTADAIVTTIHKLSEPSGSGTSDASRCNQQTLLTILTYIIYLQMM